MEVKDSTEHGGLRRMLEGGIVAINLGLAGFAEALEAQRAPVVHVDWSPPAGGDLEMIDLLEKLL